MALRSPKSGKLGAPSIFRDVLISAISTVATSVLEISVLVAVWDYVDMIARSEGWWVYAIVLVNSVALPVGVVFATLWWRSRPSANRTLLIKLAQLHAIGIGRRDIIAFGGHGITQTEEDRDFRTWDAEVAAILKKLNVSDMSYFKTIDQYPGWQAAPNIDPRIRRIEAAYNEKSKRLSEIIAHHRDL